MMALLKKLVASAVEESEGSLEEYFQARGYQVMERGRPGRHEADYYVTDSAGREFPVEEKRFRETEGSASSWYSFWRRTLNGYVGDVKKELVTQERGWLAVIDGELRDWCELSGVNVGFLAVEHPDMCVGVRDTQSVQHHVEKALQFLSCESRVANWTVDQSGSYTYFRITY